MHQISNPKYKERIEEYLERQFFMKHVGIELTRIEPGIVEASLQLSQEHQQQFGRIHGGVISTIADITAGFAAYTLVRPDQHVVTGEIKISYLRPGRGTSIFASGKVLKPGRNISFCESEVWSVENEEHILIAKASTSMVHIPLKQG